MELPPPQHGCYIPKPFGIVSPQHWSYLPHNIGVTSPNHLGLSPHTVGVASHRRLTSLQARVAGESGYRNNTQHLRNTCFCVYHFFRWHDVWVPVSRLMFYMVLENYPCVLASDIIVGWFRSSADSVDEIEDQLLVIWFDAIYDSICRLSQLHCLSFHSYNHQKRKHQSVSHRD